MTARKGIDVVKAYMNYQRFRESLQKPKTAALIQGRVLVNFDKADLDGDNILKLEDWKKFFKEAQK